MLTAMILMKLIIFIIQIVAFVISFVIIFVIFSNMATKQEVGTVKGVVWEEGRLLTQHILY